MLDGDDDQSRRGSPWAAWRTSLGATPQAEAGMAGRPANCRRSLPKPPDALVRGRQGFRPQFDFKIELARRAIVRALHASGERPSRNRSPTRRLGKPAMQTYIGTPASRVDGRAKVTGEAKYAAEFNVPRLVHASVVGSPIAKGRIARIDTAEALRVPGVLDVLTHENRPSMASSHKAYNDDVAPEGSPYRPLYDGNIGFNGQPVALVLAEDWESARFATTLVNIEYEETPHHTDLLAHLDEGFVVDKPEKPRGDARRALSAASVRHEADYTIPVEHHNPMELFASTVMWEGNGKLTIYDKTQGVQNVQRYLCSVFGMKSEDVCVKSPYVGGAFGSGLHRQFQVVLATLGALALKRPVRLVLTRQRVSRSVTGRKPWSASPSRPRPMDHWMRLRMKQLR